MDAVLVAGTVAVGTAVATSTVQSWLNTRAKTTEDLRSERLGVYPEVWERTRALSRWPRTNVTGDEIDRLHREFRHWYFSVGGLYMSENTRGRYGHMQKLIGLYLTRSQTWSSRVASQDYALLQDACSAFRTALTEDLESRRRASLWLGLQRWRHHRKELQRAVEREALWTSSNPPKPASPRPEDDERQHADLVLDPPITPAWSMLRDSRRDD